MINETSTILDEMIDVTKDGEIYLLLNGSDNKVWLFPKDCIQQGLQMYHPGSIKGKIVKRLLPYIKEWKSILPFFRAEQIRVHVKDDVLSVLQNVMGEHECLKYSFYVGDSRFVANRKIIVQIADKNEVVAYAKFTNEKTVGQTFEKEYKDLEWLASKGVSGIPEILWSGNINGQVGFVQSAIKKQQNLSVNELTNQHWVFLENLYKATGKNINFQSSSFSRELKQFEQLLEKSTWKSKDILLGVINYVREYYADETMKVSFYHGDFTPWNMTWQLENLFVFDFEYAIREYPAWLDAFHFITQVGILSDRLSGDEIYQKFIEQEAEFCLHMEAPKFHYLCYLIHILSFYYKRWNGELSEEEHSCKVWLRLIEKCFEDLQ